MLYQGVTLTMLSPASQEPIPPALWEAEGCDPGTPVRGQWHQVGGESVAVSLGNQLKLKEQFLGGKGFRSIQGSDTQHQVG